MGVARELVLTDLSAPGLDSFAAELRQDGFVVAAHAGDLCDDALLATLAGELGGGAPFELIHTAGISPSMGDWRAVIQVNWVGTEKLLRAIEPKLVSGSAAVLIVSIGGCVVPVPPEIDAVLRNPLAKDLFDKFGAIAQQMGARAGPTGVPGITYALSRRAVQRAAEARAAAWGAKGARIVTISPGTIMTPMGRLELKANPQVVEVTRNAPLGRAATPMDIAFDARFLLSDDAGFIIGCDLKIDGGAIAANQPPFE